MSRASTGKNRLRLVLVTDRYDEEIERLTGLGARPLREVKLPAVRWTTFADPEGNDFRPGDMASRAGARPGH